LRRDGGLDLLYVDWLSAKRYGATFARQNETLVRVAEQAFPDRDDATRVPALHRPS
jgi:hypothetical protein